MIPQGHDSSMIITLARTFIYLSRRVHTNGYIVVAGAILFNPTVARLLLNGFILRSPGQSLTELLRRAPKGRPTRTPHP